MIIVEPI